MSDAPRSPEGLELFERLAATTDAMVFVTDLEVNTSLWVNETLVEMTGYTLDDYRFERFENPFIPEEDVAAVAEFLGAFLASDALVSAGSVRNRFVDRWGGTLHVRSRVAKVTWGDRPALLYCTVLEEREAPSIDVEQRYRSLVEAAADAIVRLRPDPTIHFSNRGFQELVGKTPAELRTVALPELVMPSHREEIREALAGDAARVPFTAPVLGAEGHPHWLEGNFVRIAAGPDAGLLQAILRDTTEQRLLDARMEQAQKRETLGQMAGGIAHDLNNILTGILGSATLAAEDVEAGSQIAEALSDIRIAAQRAGQLSSSMLAYAGEGNAARVSLDLAELVAEMKPLLGSALPKNVQLRVRTPDVPIAVLGDEIQLRQVVMNLITNAADSMRAGGEVGLEAGIRTVTSSFGHGEHVFGTGPSEGPVAFVRVSDAGAGIPPETLERIFDPFYSTKAKGRGLGLAAVQGILGRHGGCVRVESEVGVGTEMEVVLPLTEAPIVRAEVNAPVAPERGDGVVLVVDDEALLRKLVRRILEPVGYRVLEADSGEAALTLLETQGDEIQVVVLDQTMPGMGGDRALVEIRKDRPTLPVVRTSGYVADPQLAAPDPCTLFLGKPYGVRQLIDAVQAATRDAS